MNEPTPTSDHLDAQTISMFIDSELSPAELERSRQHLSACHDCALRVVADTQLKRATARAGLRFVPPAESYARLGALLRPPQARVETPKRSNLLRLMAWSAITAALLLALSLIGWRQSRQSDRLYAEALDQHLATLSNSATPQVASSDRHTVKPWFQGRLPFSFNLPEPTALPPNTELNGADLTYFDGRPAALLLFTIGKHQVSILVMQKTGSPASVRSSETRAGFTIRSAVTSDLRIIAVSNVNPVELDRLVGILVQAQATS